MDVLGLVVRLATSSASPVVRRHALLTLQDLLAVYPLNVVPLLKTGGVRALVAAVAREVADGGGADPHVGGLLPLLLYIAVLLSNHSHDVLLVRADSAPAGGRHDSYYGDGTVSVDRA
jgi:hypothetical protein